MADGRIVIDTDINVDDFNKSVDKMEKSFNQFAKDTDNTSKSLGNKIVSNLSGAFKTLAVAITGATAGAFAWVKAAAAAGDRVDKLSQKMNLSVQEFQEWDYITKQSGTSMEALSMSMKTLAVQAEMNGKAFETLGINVKDSNGNIKDQSTLFKETLGALFKYTNQTERLAVASKVFGRGAQELAPILNAGASEIQNLQLRAHELGLVMSSEAVAASVKFGDTLNDLVSSIRNGFYKAIQNVLPQLKEVVDKFIEGTKEGGKLRETFEKMAQGTVFLIETVLPAIIDGFGWLIDNAEMVVASLVAIKLALIALTYSNPFTAIAQVIVAVLIPALTYAVQNFEKVKLYGELAAKSVMLAFASLAQWIGDKLMAVIQGLYTALSKVPFIGEQFQETVDYIKEIRQVNEEWVDGIAAGVEATKEQIKALDDEKVIMKEIVDLTHNTKKMEFTPPNALKQTKDWLEKIGQLLDIDFGKVNDFETSLQKGFGEGIQAGLKSAVQGFEAIGEALYKGENAFKAFAKSGILALASLLDAMAYKLMADAADALFDATKRGEAATGFAYAALLKTASGVIKASAGSFAHGGIVGGSSYHGDKLTANVNSGELILNEAQQGTLARSLMAIQNFMGTLSAGASSAGITVNVINNAGADVQTRESTDENGQKYLDVYIENKVAGFLGSQKGNAFMQNTFGISALGRRYG